MATVKMKYEIVGQCGRAKSAHMETVHGVIETPVFMNVGTVAAIKGGVSTDDLRLIGTQVELSNTYHLHVRTGDKVIKELGGLHRMMNWDKPILTDSGGFQVYSLAKTGRKIREEGVEFRSHMEGGYSWDRKSPWRFNPTWLPPLPWLSMSVLRHWRTGSILSPP